MITYPDGGDFIGHILAARDDVEVPQLGLETSVKVELHDDSVVDGERVETDAQERLQAPVKRRAADVYLKSKSLSYKKTDAAQTCQTIRSHTSYNYQITHQQQPINYQITHQQQPVNYQITY